MSISASKVDEFTINQVTMIKLFFNNNIVETLVDSNFFEFKLYLFNIAWRKLSFQVDQFLYKLEDVTILRQCWCTFTCISKPWKEF